MKRAKFDSLVSPSRLRLLQFFMGVLFLYLLFMSFEIPLVLRTGFGSGSGGFFPDTLSRPLILESEEDFTDKSAPARPLNDLDPVPQPGSRTPERKMREFKKLSGLLFNESSFDTNDSKDEFSVLHKSARHAFVVGKKLWDDLQSGLNKSDSKPEKQNHIKKNRTESCPDSISLSGPEFINRSRILVIPCGLTLGSHITVVGMPRWAHAEHDPKIAVLREGDESVMVAQFRMELQGLKTVDGEDPPRILHFNPRLKGDWSGKPVIEQNTCYRMQWGTALRCEGWKSRADEETVDGEVKCEKWIRDDDNGSEESKATWWLNRLIGRKKKVALDWPFPFAEGKLFVLTLRAGLEGYHVNVDGRHVTSFPYRTGFVLEDATGLSLNGDLDVHSNGRKEVNVELKKEAEYFGDVVIVPYMDNYDLVVLKTVAICEYGVRTVAAKYIMKCDDDTFVRVDAVIKEARKVGDKSLYIGNMNYYHKPLRNGKWAVTYEEWPEEEYPPYANGPGYIVSTDIAQFIVAEFEKHKLRLFKMEDVSMGMWVEKFNSSRPVEYQHSLKFCQFGCIEDYYTAHYQSPRQMLCMWDKLLNQGKPQCCNMR
ncbi:hypothetical protein COLO4_36233 [Corchorus olitorius]|uniref:Galectin domain-containing protein n=1 Tax=Corchorus olitorius TaxID=93759 RepID=A0A1R3GAC3_9ROSI|nr:hypothetical protein COLO4_36233 [Corchorus olitorius]